MSTADGPAIIRVTNAGDLDRALRDNAVQTGRAVLACVGGASGIDDGDLAALAELLTTHVIPMVDKCSATIVDGGTDSGIMRLIGQARSATDRSFQLIGVVAAGTVRVPDSAEPHIDDAADIEPNHTHIVVVPGDSWGDETPWLSAVADNIASDMPSATLVINGGAITLDDALASVLAQRPVIVLADSGRAADEIAGAQTGQSARESAQAIADSPLTTVVSMRDPARLIAAITDALNP
ncbi:hypothetical protein [Mycobacterium sp.]|uniref:hypothetical protein n=1 Tax=Mycobacterium sp. TaxID=1785 RepID=UPI002D8E4C8E|nr:hypothetical protein [Mycobacterium sp.]